MNHEENLRVTLKIYNDRNNNASNTIHAMNGFTIAFFVGILTIFKDVYLKKSPDSLSLYSLIGFMSIFELCAWRLYANFVDYDIISCYEKIIYCQENLHFPRDISLKKSLSKSKCKWLDRGHTPLDVLAFIFAIPIFYFLTVNLSNSIFWVSNLLWVSSLITIVISCGVIIWFKCEKFSRIKNLIKPK
jgi:hypothetical protein